MHRRYRPQCVVAALVTGAALVLSACSSLRVSSDHDPQADFSRYHTFSWLKREHTGNPLTVQRVHDDIQADLIAKGYRYVDDPETADFVVDFTIGRQERTQVNTYPTAYAGPYYRGGYAYGAHWWGAPYYGTQVSVSQYHEGTLTIDVFDRASHRPVWTGRAQKDISTSDIEHSEQPIREAVTAVLDDYPPKKA